MKKQLDIKKAPFAEYAVYPDGAVRHQLRGGVADGRRCGRFGKNALVLLYAAGGAGQLVAQPAPPGPAGGPVLRRWPAAGGLSQKQERQEVSPRHGVRLRTMGNP